MNPVLYILGSVGIVSLASFAGILTLAMREERLKKALSFLIALAIGAFLGDAFFHLIPESFETIPNSALISFLTVSGMLSFFLLEKLLRWHHHDASEGTHPKHSRHLGQLVLISDSFHNFIDGIIIGASYLVSIEIGIATTIAVVLHEIPQEIGDFGVLIHAGYTKATAIFYNFLSALASFGGALLIILSDSLPEQFLLGIIPFTAGVFVYIASSDLIPELHKNRPWKATAVEIIGIGLGIFAMYLLLFLE